MPASSHPPCHHDTRGGFAQYRDGKKPLNPGERHRRQPRHSGGALLR
jgi:hypothetical protein